MQVAIVTMQHGQHLAIRSRIGSGRELHADHAALHRGLAANGRDGSSATFEHVSGTSALPPIPDLLLSRSKSGPEAEEPYCVMVA
jgi:hypothetical protein